MREFITQSLLGPVGTGQSKRQTLEAFGVPLDWVGKPPGFGPQISHYEEASVWNYFGGALGIVFNRTEHIDALLVRTQKVVPNRDSIFADWPRIKNWPVQKLVDWLAKQNVPFTLARRDEVPGWLVIAEKCVVNSDVGTSGGLDIPYFDRQIHSLAAFGDATKADKFRRTGNFF